MIVIKKEGVNEKGFIRMFDAAFIAVASILNFNFPLTFLDKRNQKFEIVGNIYEGLKNGY